MVSFTITEPIKDIFHIQDAGQVCFTLICGENDSLLFDTGMGFYDVAACIAPFVRGNLHVILSHAHYDHACGQHYFPASSIHPDDLHLCRKTVGNQQRRQILKRAFARRLLPEEYPAAQFVSGTPDTVHPLEQMKFSLGNLDVEFLPAPGHTKGSIVAYIKQKQLLLTGDTWNPETWLFFPESLSVSVYRQTIAQLKLLPAEYVLRSHDSSLVSMDQFRTYCDGLNDDVIHNAVPCSITPYTHIHTYCCFPEAKSKLVFNSDKR